MMRLKVVRYISELSKHWQGFRLQTSNSWTRDNQKNNYLYNGGTELNATSGWYETMFRGYDPAVGRFMQVDPLATSSHHLTPYHYAGNNPVNFNDPLGLEQVATPYYDDLDDNGGGSNNGGGMPGKQWVPTSFLYGWSPAVSGLARGIIGLMVYAIAIGHLVKAARHTGRAWPWA